MLCYLGIIDATIFSQMQVSIELGLSEDVCFYLLEDCLYDLIFRHWINRKYQSENPKLHYYNAERAKIVSL